jgi:hypothetical protein
MIRPLTRDLCIIGAGPSVCRSPQTLAQLDAAVGLIERGLIMGKSEPFRFRPTSSTTSSCRTSTFSHQSSTSSKC